MAEVEYAVGEGIMMEFNGESFGMLCGVTGGEPNVVVRGAAVKEKRKQRGFMALKFLADRFNPKTLARLLQFLSKVIRPAVVKDVRVLRKAVEEWDLVWRASPELVIGNWVEETEVPVLLQS